MTGSSAYLLGRKIGDWPAATAPVQDLIFAAVRKDNDTLEGLEFQHCTFANVSFKEAKVRHCRFIDCAFLGCYFRKSEMVGSTFLGCKFLSCEFPKITIQSCDFKYSRFENCALPFDEMEHSLPREPNLRTELGNGLAIAADALGLQRDSRRYRLVAIQAKEEHLYAAVMSQSEWYQRHYPGLRKLSPHWANCSRVMHTEQFGVMAKNRWFSFVTYSFWFWSCSPPSSGLLAVRCSSCLGR